MENLHSLVDQLESYIPKYSLQNPSISNSTVGWQIEHSLKTINQIVYAIKKSEPNTYKWKFNFNRLLVLDILNKIPRGKAKAPKVVQPEGEITEKSLLESVKKVKENLSNWNEISKNSYFNHPFFGDLNKNSTLKFLILHTNHHLKIVEDMCKN